MNLSRGQVEDEERCHHPKAAHEFTDGGVGTKHPAHLDIDNQIKSDGGRVCLVCGFR